MFPRSDHELALEIEEWIDDLNESGESSVILVEGKKDINALRNMGVRSRIVHINKGIPLMDHLMSLKAGERPFEEIGPFDQLIILTDWDSTGGRLATKLRESCKHLDIPWDLDARKRIACLTSKWISDIESLDTLLERAIASGEGH